jgi:hypothetical protein
MVSRDGLYFNQDHVYCGHLLFALLQGKCCPLKGPSNFCTTTLTLSVPVKKDVACMYLWGHCNTQRKTHSMSNQGKLRLKALNQIYYSLELIQSDNSSDCRCHTFYVAYFQENKATCFLSEPFFLTIFPRRLREEGKGENNSYYFPGSKV